MYIGWKTIGPIGVTLGLCLWAAAPVPGNAASGVYVVKNINTHGSSESAAFVVIRGHVYFRADDGVHGSELWRSDGSEAGTTLVADLSPGSSSSAPSSFTSFAGRVFFAASSPATGREVWFTNERHDGARLLKDINPGANDGIDPLGFLFLLAGDRLYFPALNEVGIELWLTDGTTRGTRLIKDIHLGVPWSVPVFLTRCGETSCSPLTIAIHRVCGAGIASYGSLTERRRGHCGSRTSTRGPARPCLRGSPGSAPRSSSRRRTAFSAPNSGAPMERSAGLFS